MNYLLKGILDKIEGNEIDLFSLNINISTRKNIAGWIGDAEPDDVCTKYHITLNYTTDFELDESIEIAEALCHRIDPTNVLTEEEHYLFDVADSISGDIMSAIYPYIDSNGSLKVEYMDQSILYIDLIKVDKNYRSKGLGSFLLYYIIYELLDVRPIITLIPNPLDYKDRKCESYINDKRKLEKFYMDFGFIKKVDEVWSYKGI